MFLKVAMKPIPPYSNKIVFLVVALLCFILYGNTLQNGYNLDDAWAFQEKGNADVLTEIQESFTTRYVNIGELDYGYRPISSLVFALEQGLFGQNPIVSHFINVLLYAFVCFVLFLWLTKQLKIGWWLAVSITATFLFLPIHSEVVNSVKNRDELLSALFGILFLIWSWKFYRQGGALTFIIGMLFFFLSLLSKSNTLPLLFALPVGLWITEELNKRRLLLLAILPFVVTLLLQKTIVEIAGFGETKNANEFVENPLYGEHTAMDRVVVASNSFGFYLFALVSVEPFSSYYGYDTIEFLKWHFGYISAIVIFVLVALFLLFKYIQQRKYKLSLFALVFAMFCLGPFLNILTRMPGVVGERLIFLSSIGFAIIAGSFVHIALAKAKRLKKELVYVYIIIIVLIGGIWSVKTIRRNKDWNSLESLMTADLKVYPRAVKLNMIMGSVRYNEGVVTKGEIREIKDLEKVIEARNYFEKALNVYDQHAVAIYNIAWVDTYVLDGDVDITSKRWWKLVEMEVLDSAAVMPFIVHLMEKKGDTKDVLRESLDLCQKGDHQSGLNGMRIALSEKKWSELWEFSECLYSDIGQRREQLTSVWKNLIAVDPEKAEALIDALIDMDSSVYYGKIKVKYLMEKGQLPVAMSLLSELNNQVSNDVEIKLLIGNLYTSFNQKDNALKSFKEALALDPNNEKLKNYVRSLENNP